MSSHPSHPASGSGSGAHHTSNTTSGNPGQAKQDDKPKALIPMGFDDANFDKATRETWENEYETIRHRGYALRNMTMIEEDVNADWKQYASSYKMPKRPGKNTSGRAIPVGVNMHEIRAFTNKSSYITQYDITFTGGTGLEKRGLMRAIWFSKSVEQTRGGGWIWNGDKIAWSLKKINNLKITVDLDKKGEKDKTGEEPPKHDDPKTRREVANQRVPHGEEKHDAPKRSNTFTIQIRPTKTFNLDIITNYLKNPVKPETMDSEVLEAINFLNHVVRETPSGKLNNFKNSFFPKETQNKYDIGGCVFALKGAFQSIRMTNFNDGNLMMNVDVAHSTFYMNHRISDAVGLIIGVPTVQQVLSLVQKFQNDPPVGKYKDSPSLKKIRHYLKKLSFHVDYEGMSEKTKHRKWIIKDISYDTARSRKLEFTDKKTKKSEFLTVQEYFKKVYNVRLEHPGLPLIETTKSEIYYPMELCIIDEGQRYPFKLDERQTADMIKFAVSRPAQRLQSIQDGLRNLDWQNDRVLQHFGVKINPTPIETQARLLDPPKVLFGNNKTESPGTSGRWRIDGKPFYRPNVKAIKHWGVCIIDPGRGGQIVSDQEAATFVNSIVTLYKQYGGRFENPAPAKCRASENDTAAAVDNLVKAMRARGSASLGEKEYPDLLIFFLPRKNTETYQRLKRCAELKWGSISQCIQSAHVKKNQAQYIGNVLMKINAKLGGASFKAMPIKGPVSTNGGRYFNVPTMIIGADVSHPSPGSLGSSMAALTVSMDRDAIRYGAAVQSNGHRLEMITTWNWNDMLGPMAREWISSVGGGRFPQHVYYFRDGVSEGQYEHVIQQEVRDIHHVFKNMDPSNNGSNIANLKFTVVVCSKRHHIRLFPKGPAADRNGNAQPGTIVERDVCSSNDYDFYLNSHSAIQGTARPCLYTILMDQANVPVNLLQNMIYEHCYQYIRSSTPVSLYPAVYYAHLASRRAQAHERQGKPFSTHKSSEKKERYILERARAEADVTGKVMTMAAVAKLKEYTLLEYPPVIPTCNPSLWFGMWFI